jgi:hypothetical protein
LISFARSGGKADKDFSVIIYIKIICSMSMVVDSKICVLYIFSNGDNVTNAFTEVYPLVVEHQLEA